MSRRRACVADSLLAAAACWGRLAAAEARLALSYGAAEWQWHMHRGRAHNAAVTAATYAFRAKRSAAAARGAKA